MGTPCPHCPTGGRRAYVVVQALHDLDAVVAEIELPQVHQALQALDLGQPVALQEGESEQRGRAKPRGFWEAGLLNAGA